MTTFNVVSYGADPSGATDSTAEVQAALNAVGAAGGGTLLFPAGTYKISSYLRILPPGNIIISAYGAKLLRATGSPGFTLFKNYNATTNYPVHTGPSNITFAGGTYDMASPTSSLIATQAISIAHSANLTIQDIIIQNVVGGHAIEINSTQTALVHNITFRGFVMTTENVGEALQIDGTFSTGMIGSAPWDQTACDDITVRDCVMIPYNGQGVWGTFVGTHSGREHLPHTNITIKDNVVTSNSHYGIKAMNWRNVTITGNQFIDGNAGILAIVRDDCHAIDVDNTETQWLTISNNSFTNMGNCPWSCVGQLTEVVKIHGLPAPFSPVTDVVFDNNTIDGFDNPEGISVKNAGDITLSNNKVINPTYTNQVNIVTRDSRDVTLTANTVSSNAAVLPVVMSNTTNYTETGTVATAITTEDELMPNVLFVENLTVCTTTSVTYADVNPLSSNMVVPPSGKVLINLQVRGAAAGATFLANSFRIAKGATTVLLESDARNAQLDDNGDKTVGYQYLADFGLLPGGVVPGDTITVTFKHRTAAGGTGTIRGRSILLTAINV